MTKTAELDDLSPAAVSARLEELRALYRLTMSLTRARILGPAEAAPEVRRTRR
jgi:predicted component of type VI protein secretion system